MKHKKKPAKIVIKTPCSEDWNKMTPKDKGRFCQSCEKTVIDFSAMTANEIYHALYSHEGKICGRFRKQQIVNYNKSQIVPTSSNLRKWSIAAALAGVLAYPNFAQQDFIQEPMAMVLTNNYTDLIEEEIQQIKNPVEDTILISGKVTDTHGNILPGATIVIEGTEWATIVDGTGHYKIKVPKSMDSLVIVADYYDEYYQKNRSIKPNKSQKNIDFKLEYDENFEMLIGDVELIIEEFPKFE